MRTRSLVLFCLSALLFAACRGRATPDVLPTAPLPTDTALAPTSAPPEATATSALPTATAEPATATATASATPSEVPATPTATVPATPDPNEGVGEVVFQDALDGTGRWFWGFSDDVASFGIVDGQLKAVMTQPSAGWRFTISPDDLNIADQQARLTAHTAACGENDEYGLMFRGSTDAEDNYQLYLFKLRCGGAARFEVVRGSDITPIVDWTTSAAINTGAPADNTLMVWAAGDQFRFYVNDQYLFSAQDAALTSGYYGVYIYDRTAGGLTVNFEDLVVRTVAR
jgi:hypothetical protein